MRPSHKSHSRRRTTRRRSPLKSSAHRTRITPFAARSISSERRSFSMPFRTIGRYRPRSCTPTALPDLLKFEGFRDSSKFGGGKNSPFEECLVWDYTGRAPRTSKYTAAALTGIFKASDQKVGEQPRGGLEALSCISREVTSMRRAILASRMVVAKSARSRTLKCFRA